MKHTLLLLLLASPLHGQLLATISTTRGNVIVTLHFDKTPQTVANFITLARATRNTINPATGAVIRKPFYVGEKFYKVLNDPSGRLAQTGSGTGTTSGGPGYMFRDEFDATLPHGPYILAMENDGTPHTNGSQIYFTGVNGFPDDVGKNTVFGSVTDSASRGVINSILTAGNNATTINSVTFQRNSAAAIAFNEHAQDLPVCEGIKGHLQVTRDGLVDYVLDLPQPEGSFFLFARSPDLQGWGFINKLYQGTGFSDRFNVIIDDATSSRAFYNIASVRHPDALGPEQSVLEGESLSINLAAGRSMVFSFTSGEAGTFTDSTTAGSAAFTVFSYVPEPYKAIFIMESGTLSYRFDCFLDDKVAGQVIGRCVASQKSGNSSISLGAGTLNLTQTP